MIDASTRINDGVWPSRSQAPTPRLIGCRGPHPRCEALCIFIDGQCTKPAFNPSGSDDECPFLIPEWKPGHAPQVSHSGSRVVSMDKSGSVMLWVADTLGWIAAHGHNRVRPVAYGFLHDLDVVNTLDDLEALGEAMLMRLEYEKPWERVAAS